MSYGTTSCSNIHTEIGKMSFLARNNAAKTKTFCRGHQKAMYKEHSISYGEKCVMAFMNTFLPLKIFHVKNFNKILISAFLF